MLMTTQLFDNTNKLHLGICKDQPLHISEALALHNQVTGELYDGQCGVVDLPPHHILDLKIYTTGELVLVVEKASGAGIVVWCLVVCVAFYSQFDFCRKVRTDGLGCPV